VTDFSVVYCCDLGCLPDPRETAAVAEKSFLDYVPCAKPSAIACATGECVCLSAPEDVARAVTTILLTSPSVRKPSTRAARSGEEGEEAERRDRYIADQNRAEIERRVVVYIRKREPIPGIMVWSPKKHWVSGEESAIDIAELVALQTLFDLNVAVTHAYAPGLHFHLRVEDIEHAFIHSGDPGLEEDMERYISQLGMAVQVLGVESAFTVSRVTSLAKDAREIEAWRSRLQQNFEALRAYWHDSEKRGWDGYEQYGTYKALASLGWQGPIPQEMRDHYLARIQRGLGQDEPAAGAADMVMRNLAGILLHQQEKLLRVDDYGKPVILSFMPQPPGTLLHFMFGRVNLVFVPRRLSSSANYAAPWSVKGCLRERKGKLLPTFTSWHQPLGQYAQAVAGTLELTRGQQRFTVRADLLLHNKEHERPPEQRLRV